MKKSILILNRYEIFEDGIIYDTKKAEDIPQWIFEFRDFVEDIAEKRIMDAINDMELKGYEANTILESIRGMIKFNRYSFRKVNL